MIENKTEKFVYLANKIERLIEDEGLSAKTRYYEVMIYRD